MPVDVVAEVVQVLPGQSHLMEAPERERAVEDERVVALRRREDEPEDRRDEEDREHHEDRHAEAEAEDAGRHQSSVLKRPLRVTMACAPKT